MECIFCEFLSGARKKHENGFPFIILSERPHSVSFLSIDFPEDVDGHLLVIPRKHYSFFEDIPNYIKHDIIEHVSTLSSFLREEYPGTNLLLNNGSAAEQYVMHSHFHIIPRTVDDNMEVAVWKEKEMSQGDFVELTQKIIKGLKNLTI